MCLPRVRTESQSERKSRCGYDATIAHEILHNNLHYERQTWLGITRADRLWPDNPSWPSFAWGPLQREVVHDTLTGRWATHAPATASWSVVSHRMPALDVSVIPSPSPVGGAGSNCLWSLGDNCPGRCSQHLGSLFPDLTEEGCSSPSEVTVQYVRRWALKSSCSEGCARPSLQTKCMHLLRDFKKAFAQHNV